jgi:hypothetical protein
VAEIKKLRKGGMTVPDIMRQTKFSKASVYVLSEARLRRPNPGQRKRRR